MIEGIKEDIWLHMLIHSHDLKMEKHVLYCDIQSVLSLAKKIMYIDVMLNFMYDILEEDEFSILKIDTKVNPTYMLIESLPTKKFKLLLDLVNVDLNSLQGNTDRKERNYMVSRGTKSILKSMWRLLNVT